jgi:hypothetical protein
MMIKCTLFWEPLNYFLLKNVSISFVGFCRWKLFPPSCKWWEHAASGRGKIKYFKKQQSSWIPWQGLILIVIFIIPSIYTASAVSMCVCRGTMEKQYIPRITFIPTTMKIKWDICDRVCVSYHKLPKTTPIVFGFFTRIFVQGNTRDIHVANIEPCIYRMSALTITKFITRCAMIFEIRFSWVVIKYVILDWHSKWNLRTLFAWGNPQHNLKIAHLASTWVIFFIYFMLFNAQKIHRTNIL